MIRLENVAKTFGRKPALHGLSLDVAAGEIFGLLGHNGAGKSTTFGVILGQVYPDRGEAFINDVSVQRDRSTALARTGAIFETPGFYDYLSGWKNLVIFTSYTARVPRREIEEAVEIVGLTARIGDPVRTYSHGMRQRLALAQAILPSPEVILLDEPTEGLDPEGIHEMRNLIRSLNKTRGMTVLLSSHLLSEVEQLCDRIAIMNQGHLVFHGRWTDLQPKGESYRLEVDDWTRASATCEARGVRVLGEGQIAITDGADVSDLVAAFVTAGIKVRGLARDRPSLESLYLETMAGTKHDKHGAEKQPNA